MIVRVRAEATPARREIARGCEPFAAIVAIAAAILLQAAAVPVAEHASALAFAAAPAAERASALAFAPAPVFPASPIAFAIVVPVRIDVPMRAVAVAKIAVCHV